jgi:hypothetical protein
VGTEGEIKENRMEQNEIDIRFTYHAPKAGQPEIYTKLRDKAKELAELINEVCPESSEKTKAIYELEVSVFWANAAIARRG